jgi:DNA-binding NtrC family response regulator
MDAEIAGRRHILVVDDDLQYRTLVVRMLGNAGFHVSAAGDFSAAIEIIEGNQRVHLLLTDVRMPAGTPNGVAIGRMVRFRRHRLPIVYMTGSYDTAELSAVEPHVPVLQKPFTIQKLLKTIEVALIDD